MLFRSYRVMALVRGGFLLLQNLLTLASFVTVLLAFNPWIALVLFGAAIPAFVGTPAQLVDHLGGLSDQGIDAFQLVFTGWPEHEDLALFASEVRPALPRDPR